MYMNPGRCLTRIFFWGGVINSLGNLPQEDKISNKSLVCCKLSILANNNLLPVGRGRPKVALNITRFCVSSETCAQAPEPRKANEWALRMRINCLEKSLVTSPWTGDSNMGHRS